MDIDVVIPWVDGNDPVLKAKRFQYGDKNALSRADVGGDTRYADLGEIHWCVRSINKFAPFVRRIFIVTDGQDPNVQSSIPVEIIDHKDLFRDHLQYLPVFNSTSIETLIWNIPQMSEHFLLMNDDFVLTKPVTPEDFFTEDGKVYCYGKKKSSLTTRIIYNLSVLKYGYRRATFKMALMKGCRMGGMKGHFIHLVHTPRPLLKSVYQNYYTSHPGDIDANVKYRFRNLDRYQVQALEYALLESEGRMSLVDPSDKLFFIQHWNGPEYIQKKLTKAKQNPSCKFSCFNSLDQASPEERQLVVSWIEQLLSD